MKTPSSWKTTLPFLIALGVVLAVVISGLKPEHQTYTEYDVASFGLLPVQVGGRIKPLDTLARVNLMLLSERQSLKPDMAPSIEGGLSASEWFMEVTMRPERANDFRIFKIVFPEDLGLEGLKEEGTRYYSFNELAPYIPEIRAAYDTLDPQNPANAYEKQILKVHDSLARYQQLLQSFHPADTLDGLIGFYTQFEAVVPAGMVAFQQQQAGEEFNARALEQFFSYLITFQQMSEAARIRLIPPEDGGALQESDWANIGTSLMESVKKGGVDPFVLSYARLTEAFRQDQPAVFNDTVQAMVSTLEDRYPEQVTRVHFEKSFNAFSPFLLSIVLYLIAFILTGLAWLGSENNRVSKTAFWILLFTFLIHTFGLAARMYIQGRPPVTNLYASAIFVGWGSVLLCSIIEPIFKNGIANAAGALVGIVTLIVAHNLAILSGDTLEMVRAVLDSNFWLATHVVIITLGYSAMFVAGALALFFVIRAVFTPHFNRAQAKSMAAMVYGIICFAALFSLVGTILGGIWADQSWGRFWGWDPKENGALLIVLITAIILHVRWGNIAGERGVMNLAIFGNIVTSWSWFGTNMLGVGLHSYGFMDSAFVALMGFWGSQVLFIAIGSTPYSWWRSEFGKSLSARQARRDKRKISDSTQPKPAQ